MTKTLMDFVQIAKANIQEVEVLEANKLINDGWQVVDVREADEIIKGTINENAIHIPRGVLESAIDLTNKEGNKVLQQGRNDKWLILCRTGGRSAMATDVMQQMGFTNVKNINGGVMAWIDANLPIVNLVN